jgi:GT2 family glycosyltransferase
MSAQTAVDVIILSWNRVDDTIAAIESAASQEGVAARILIVDQGSEPHCLEQLEALVSSLPNAELKKLSANSGVAGGRNIATAMGAAPYVVALDSDAVFADETMLARAVACLSRDENLCAVGFRIKNYFTGEDDATSWDYPAGCSPSERFTATRFIGAGHAVRRKSFAAVGGYDSRLFFCGEELDLCYRMLNLGMRIQYDPEIVIRHKVSPEHRVFWERGRFFYTVRNALYCMYKFEIPWLRRVLGGIAFLVKGLRNGVFLDALRAILASRRLSRDFRNSPGEAAAYRLTPATWSYIFQYERSRNDSLMTKILRQLSLLPRQGNLSEHPRT